MPLPGWSAAQAVDAEERGGGKISPLAEEWHLQSYLLGAGTGSFSRSVAGLSQERQTEQLRTKLNMAEDINYLRGAAIPLGRKGKGERRAVRTWGLGL